ncbi:MAG: hypothetical protein ACLQBK_06560 [Candidatus Sulfotelmatobacter sp.]
MASRGDPNHTYRNRILAALPGHEMARLAPHLSPIILDHNYPLLDDGQIVTNAYFLEEGIASIDCNFGSGAVCRSRLPDLWILN